MTIAAWIAPSLGGAAIRIPAPWPISTTSTWRSRMAPSVPAARTIARRPSSGPPRRPSSSSRNGSPAGSPLVAAGAMMIAPGRSAPASPSTLASWSLSPPASTIVSCGRRAAAAATRVVSSGRRPRSSPPGGSEAPASTASTVGSSSSRARARTSLPSSEQRARAPTGRGGGREERRRRPLGRGDDGDDRRLDGPGDESGGLARPGTETQGLGELGVRRSQPPDEERGQRIGTHAGRRRGRAEQPPPPVDPADERHGGRRRPVVDSQEGSRFAGHRRDGTGAAPRRTRSMPTPDHHDPTGADAR